MSDEIIVRLWENNPCPQMSVFPSWRGGSGGIGASRGVDLPTAMLTGGESWQKVAHPARRIGEALFVYLRGHEGTYRVVELRGGALRFWEALGTGGDLHRGGGEAAPAAPTPEVVRELFKLGLIVPRRGVGAGAGAVPCKEA